MRAFARSAAALAAGLGVGDAGALGATEANALPVDTKTSATTKKRSRMARSLGALPAALLPISGHTQATDLSVDEFRKQCDPRSWSLVGDSEIPQVFLVLCPHATRAFYEEVLVTKSVSILRSVKGYSLAALALAAFAGCSGGGAISAPTLGSAMNAQGTAALPATSLADAGTGDLVYVSDQLQKSVLAFPASERAHNPSPALTIPLGVIPEGVWVDRKGILYVALSGQSPTQAGMVEEFKPGAASPFRTITEGITVPQSLVVDANGALYVDQIFDTTVEIQIYPPGSSTPGKTLVIKDKGEPAAGGLTLDSNGNIYVHTLFIDDPPSRVFRFARGESTPHDLHLQGLGNAIGLASDASGNLYVADSADGISIYASGSTSPSRQITPPASETFANFVSTRSGMLYVAQENAHPSASSLLEYAVGGSQPANVLSGSLQAPVSASLRAAAF